MSISLEASRLADHYKKVCCYFEDLIKQGKVPATLLKKHLADDVRVVNETQGQKTIEFEGIENVANAFKKYLFDNTTNLKLYVYKVDYKKEDIVDITMRIEEKKDGCLVDVEERTSLSWKKCGDSFKISKIHMHVVMKPIEK